MSSDGCLIAVNDAVADMLAACPAFQAWCGASTAAVARGRIYTEELPPPQDEDRGYSLREWRILRPYAIVTNVQHRKVSVAPGQMVDAAFTVAVLLEQDVPRRISHRESSVIGREFATSLGRIMDDLQGLSARNKIDGSGSYPDLAEIATDPDAVWMRSNDDDNLSDDENAHVVGDAVCAAIILRMGSGG